jgi:hypothetical protein
MEHYNRKFSNIGLILILVLMFLLTGCLNKEGDRVKDYFENGNLKRDYLLVDGNIDGLAFYYYDTGELEGKVNWVSGIRKGLTTMYYKSENIKSEINYINNKQTGKSKFFYDNENNTLHKYCNYIDGIINATYKQYLQNGDLKFSALYYQDSIVLDVEHNEQGQMIGVNFFVDFEIPDSINKNETINVELKLFNKDRFGSVNLVEGYFQQDKSNLVVKKRTKINKDNFSFNLTTTEEGINYWSGGIECISILDTNKYITFPILFSYYVD